VDRVRVWVRVLVFGGGGAGAEGVRVMTTVTRTVEGGAAGLLEMMAVEVVVRVTREGVAEEGWTPGHGEG
jgi:hypothetical protein